MNLLITGGCGFVGSSVAIYFKQKYPNYNIVVLDNLKRRGSELNISRLLEVGIEFIHGDIRIANDFNSVGHIDYIIDAAAEPSVQSGIFESPDYLIHTNFLGTYHTLEFAKKNNAGVLFLSTSRVYSIKSLLEVPYYETESRLEFRYDNQYKGVTKSGVNEEFDLSGYRSLYGATKFASEMLVLEYNALFGLKTVINRCGVLTGPWQMGKVDQGFIVLWMAKHFWKGELSYIGFNGEGKQVRDILHIYDLFRLLDFQLHNLLLMNGQTFNVGGGYDTSLSLKELSTYCSNLTGNQIRITPNLEERKADIPIYITDNTKVQLATGWKPQYSTEDILSEIFIWIKKNQNHLKPILS